MSAVAAAVMPHLEAEGRVALDGVDFRARLRDLLCEVTTTQTYRNLEAVPIEAVYTFPLPLGATLLELTLTLGERVLKGTVVGRAAAERRYEDAITDGDAAVLLTESGPGLYTLNVGNLLPGERAVIRFTYALLQDWQDGSLRFRLPTTLAPRYGDAVAAGLRPHEVPETTLSGENPFTLEVTLEGLLARAALDWPSHRVFTVGVGSAVSEPTVRALAEATGGACELVSPNEDLAERIHRHFKRLLLPRATSARVRWPSEPAECLPETLEAVYDGDTVHVFARFPEPPIGEAVLEVTLADGRTLTQRAVLTPEPAAATGEGPSTLARLARARELKALTDAEAGAALAVCYQLLSPWTGYVVVADRAEGERAAELPALRKVPQMLAAGWGGAGSVRAALADVDYRDRPAFLRRQADDTPVAASLAGDWDSGEALPSAKAPPRSPRRLLRDLFRRRDVSRPVPSVAPLTELVEALNRLHAPGSGGGLGVVTVAELEALGAGAVVVGVLRQWVAAGLDERSVVVVFLHLLAEEPAGAALGRDARRAISRAYKALTTDAAVLAGLRLDLLRKLPAVTRGALAQTP